MVNGHPRNARKTNVKAANYSSSLHTENVGCGKMYAWDLEKSDVMKQVQMALMVTLATLAVFIKSLHPSLPGGDSGMNVWCSYPVTAKGTLMISSQKNNKSLSC